MAGGRPTKYDPKFCEEMIEVMKQGLSYEAVAGHLGINKDTLYRWAKIYPEFSDAKSIGLEYSRLFWEKNGIEGMWHHPEDKKLNSPVWIFNMKNRFGWRERNETTELPPDQFEIPESLRDD